MAEETGANLATQTQLDAGFAKVQAKLVEGGIDEKTAARKVVSMKKKLAGKGITPEQLQAIIALIMMLIEMFAS